MQCKSPSIFMLFFIFPVFMFQIRLCLFLFCAIAVIIINWACIRSMPSKERHKLYLFVLLGGTQDTCHQYHCSKPRFGCFASSHRGLRSAMPTPCQQQTIPRPLGLSAKGPRHVFHMKVWLRLFGSPESQTDMNAVCSNISVPM